MQEYNEHLVSDIKFDLWLLFPVQVECGDIIMIFRTIVLNYQHYGYVAMFAIQTAECIVCKCSDFTA